MTQRLWKADIHNHSCLSPCGSLENSPRAMALRAREAGIDLLGLTDHNTARNLPAFEACCHQVGIEPIFGLEVTTEEEIHCLTFFETLEEALSFGSFIEFLLPEIDNDPELFGDQVYVDEEENIEGIIEKSLLSACPIRFEDLIEETLSRNGLAIPAHIDRAAFSVSSQLGFLPDLPYSALEVVSLPVTLQTYGKTLIRDSDAHYLADMAKRTFIFPAERPGFRSLSEALKANSVGL